MLYYHHYASVRAIIYHANPEKFAKSLDQQYSIRIKIVYVCYFITITSFWLIEFDSNEIHKQPHLNQIGCTAVTDCFSVKSVMVS